MNQENTNVLNFAEGNRPQLPSGLNVLTILTFIGCALAFIGSIWAYVSAYKSYQQALEMKDKMGDAPAWAKRFANPEMIEITRKSAENRLPILIIGIVGIVLCFYGALQMRQLKKQGYTIWLIGEILPLAASILFVGIGLFSGIYLVALIFPILFIILYTTQRKYLIY